MPRRLVGSSIEDLESLFDQARKKKDGAKLKELAAELEYRRKPRARSLAQRVAAALGTAGATDDGRRADTAQNARSRGRNQGARNTQPSLPLGDPPARPGRRGEQTRQPRNRVAITRQPTGRSPTPEQEAAISAFLKGGSLKINAYAGTGKTSTLEMLSHRTSDRGQYLAFNRSIVDEARERFPSTVNCATTHQLAYHAVKSAYRHGDKMTGKVSAQQLAEILKIKKAWKVDRDHILQPRSQTYLVLETIKNFAQSGDDLPDRRHVPRHGSLLAAPEEALAEVADFAVKTAKAVWDRMCDPADPIPLGFNGYLKLWALGRPKIAADFILLDEAQDTNPVVLEVLRQQDAQIVYVGDRYQQIYEWRGAVNAMDHIKTDAEESLTQSFRFGAGIAEAASAVLRTLGANTTLTGNPRLDSRVGPCRPHTILSRTNANVIATLIEALNEGRSPHLVGGSDDLKQMLYGVRDLKNGEASTYPEFFGFQTWDEVVAFAQTTEGEHLLTFVNLVQARGERQLLWALNRAVGEDEADLVLSTAHRAKGREWDNVRLNDDFLKTRPAKPENALDKERFDRERASELRLFYVALTRAKKIVEVPSPLTSMLSAPTTAPAPRCVPASPRRSAAPPAPTPASPIPATPATPATAPQPAQRRRGFLRRILDL